MNKIVFLISAFASLLLLSACSNDDDDTESVVDTPVVFGDPPADTIVESGTVDVITGDSIRYHVLTFDERVTSTIVETETGLIIVDVAFKLIANSGTELRAYSDALEKPISVVITHAHRDHYENIDLFTDTNIYAETSSAAVLLADPIFTALFSGTVNDVTGTVELAGVDVVFENISSTEASENGYISIPGDNSLFLGDLAFNRAHAYIREYTPLDDSDELDTWIDGLRDIKTKYGDYRYVFLGHTGYRSDVSANLDENIAYLSDAQGLIKGTKELTSRGFATSVRDVTDELKLLYPLYEPGGLELALPGGFGPGDPGANWFE